ncbi:MAG: transmembrane domain-containing protein [Candidatus Zixiibacteriota bacterium]
MIVIGVVGLCLVALLWVLLYFYFIRRSDRFMETWEKEIRERAEKATLNSIQSLQKVAKAMEALPESIQSLEEAAEAIKASRQAMERFASERGLISKPSAEEITTPGQMTESELEPILSPTPSVQFTPYETRRSKDWEYYSPSSVQPAVCFH